MQEAKAGKSNLEEIREQLRAIKSNLDDRARGVDGLVREDMATFNHVLITLTAILSSDVLQDKDDLRALGLIIFLLSNHFSDLKGSIESNVKSIQKKLDHMEKAA